MGAASSGSKQLIGGHLAGHSSLVTMEFVNWRSVGMLVGREVRTDKMGRLIWNQFDASEERSYRHPSVIVWPSVGVRMEKHKGALRTQVPEHVLRVRQQW